MTADIAFVACSKTKAGRPAPAAALYLSPLFRKSLQAALDRARKVLILSAEHGVVDLDSILAPYDTTLKRMTASKRQAWIDRVAADLSGRVGPESVEVFCGDEYLAPIRLTAERNGWAMTDDLKGLSLGQRLQRLSSMNNEGSVRSIYAQFQKAIYRLWVAQSGGRLVRETTGRQAWPRRGVYFLLDADVPAANGKMPRIVRVGTHAVSAKSKTTLWDRLSTHRGTTVGTGSHRSSIFRLHVGRALINRDPDQFPQGTETWGRGQSAPVGVRATERSIEAAVSGSIGAMRLLWLDVPDEPSATSERAYIERNSIALISRVGLMSGFGRREWLGGYSPEWRIAVSGLWNLNHVLAPVDARFISHFNSCVDRTVGQMAAQRYSCAQPDPLVEFQFPQDNDERAASAEPN